MLIYYIVDLAYQIKFFILQMTTNLQYTHTIKFT